MTEKTPYDADRAGFTRRALARLVPRCHAVDLAESATGLVANDEHPVSSGLVLEEPRP
ncbi:hypothetical protein ACFUJR_29585 [Streptomyces sp. NPDC057271]|uniref:hypothetical protein n=1 Tax=unclassified Streptomyces TaxID=2593676 RepID=UPI00363267BC